MNWELETQFQLGRKMRDLVELGSAQSGNWL
jgi:hypothetical protein